MNLYAIKIKKSDLALITMLNNGVTPKVEKKETYFIFDATWKTDFIPQIIETRECWNKYEIKGNSPLLLKVKE